MAIDSRTLATDGWWLPPDGTTFDARAVAMDGWLSVEVVTEPTWSNPHPDFIRTHNVRTSHDTPATISMHVAIETDVPAFVSPHHHHVLRVTPAIDKSHLR